tara:strand:+ start:881 stop:1105 length:225 start_codon:yes stop_codon:yes gene_type:complete
MSNYKSDVLDALRNKAETDRFQALSSLKIMLNHPAGIGDHSTSDLHNNLNEALSQLADADDRLETLRRYWEELK